jgi:hypothetical protein
MRDTESLNRIVTQRGKGGGYLAKRTQSLADLGFSSMTASLIWVKVSVWGSCEVE